MPVPSSPSERPPAELLPTYRQAAAEREALGVPPLPLTPPQTQALTELLQAPPAGEEAFLLELLGERIPPGVDEAAYVKATWLSAVAAGTASSPLVSPVEATRLLATMIGGYNVGALIELLGSADAEVAAEAARGLSRTLLVYDAFDDVLELAETNPLAKQVVDSWAAAEWFTARPPLSEAITVTVFKVDGETNTDDFSPARHAPTRPDIPLHALAMGETRIPGGIDEIARARDERAPRWPSSATSWAPARRASRPATRCSGTSASDIPHVPNKRTRRA